LLEKIRYFVDVFSRESIELGKSNIKADQSQNVHKKPPSAKKYFGKK